MRLTLVIFSVIWLTALILQVDAQPIFFDRTFQSEIFNDLRYYRIFLPKEYSTETKATRYPVIYYFHGHSDRYTLEHHDKGKDTVPKIAKFVAENNVIVVAVDGFVKQHYNGFYGGYPWDALRSGGDYDFGAHFLEIVAHIDTEYRTHTTRRYRATSGLSMGGFMSLYLSARFPDVIGSASAFNPAPEFFTGNRGSRMLWRPKDHIACHNHSMIRLIRASGDYISQYHEETRAAYVCAPNVDFEYRLDEYHRHWATSIGETFEFHMKAFDNTQLDSVPNKWSYASAYNNFNAWGCDVNTVGEGKTFVYLTNVQTNGLRVTTRRWAPDGPPATGKQITIVTSPCYQPRKRYKISDLNLLESTTTRFKATSDDQGRLKFKVDGGGHQLSVFGLDVPPSRVALLPITLKDHLRLWANKVLSLPIRIYNPSDKPLLNVQVELSSAYPTVEWHKKLLSFSQLLPGEVGEAEDRLQVRFYANNEYFARTRLEVTLSAQGQSSETIPLDVLVIPEQVSLPAEVEILDGRTATFTMFRQKGNQGGGNRISRTVTEGNGNGDGRLQPGEIATFWVKVKQGLDPKDKNNWHRTKVYSDSPWLIECDDIQEPKQREWTNAQERTSAVHLTEDTPPGTNIPVLLSNETWSFRYTPDVKYGKETLYQAFQEHQYHLHQFDFNAGKSSSTNGEE